MRTPGVTPTRHICSQCLETATLALGSPATDARPAAKPPTRIFPWRNIHSRRRLREAHYYRDLNDLGSLIRVWIFPIERTLSRDARAKEIMHEHGIVDCVKQSAIDLWTFEIKFWISRECSICTVLL